MYVVAVGAPNVLRSVDGSAGSADVCGAPAYLPAGYFAHYQPGYVPKNVVGLKKEDFLWFYTSSPNGAGVPFRNAVPEEPLGAVRVHETTPGDWTVFFGLMLDGEAIESLRIDVIVIKTEIEINGTPNETDDITCVTPPQTIDANVRVQVSEHIRASNTPANMRDRIPPRVNTPIQVQIEPDLRGTGQAVRLHVAGESADNGTVLIDGSPFVDLAKSGTIQLSGGTQTAPATRSDDFSAPNAGKLALVGRVREADAVRSQGFSVAAICDEVRMRFLDAVRGVPDPFGGFAWGSRFRVEFRNDSESQPDLNCVLVSEVPTIRGSPSGVAARWWGGATISSSWYSGTRIDRVDWHVAGARGPSAQAAGSVLINDLNQMGPGTSIIDQHFVFMDRRAGATEDATPFVVPTSGFRIVYTADATSAGAFVRITKTPRAHHGVAAGQVDDTSTKSISLP